MSHTVTVPRPQDAVHMLRQLDMSERPYVQARRYWGAFQGMVPKWSREISLMMREGIHDVPLMLATPRLYGLHIMNRTVCIVGEGNGWSHDYRTYHGSRCEFCRELSRRMPYATLARGRYAGGGETYIPSILETVPAFVKHFRAHHRKGRGGAPP